MFFYEKLSCAEVLLLLCSHPFHLPPGISLLPYGVAQQYFLFICSGWGRWVRYTYIRTTRKNYNLKRNSWAEEETYKNTVLRRSYYITRKTHISSFQARNIFFCFYFVTLFAFLLPNNFLCVKKWSIFESVKQRCLVTTFINITTFLTPPPNLFVGNVAFPFTQDQNHCTRSFPGLPSSSLS